MGVVKRKDVNKSTRHNPAQQQAAQQQELQQQELHAQGAHEGINGAEDLNKQLRKTKFCMYHLQGVCMFGDNCAFAHNCSELQGAPDLRKTRLCNAFVAGHCKDPHCTFAHGEDELHSTDLFYKKTLCIWFEKGRCRNNDQCRFAHGAKELRLRGGGGNGGKSAGHGPAGPADGRPVGRAGGQQVVNNRAPAGDMMGDWALLVSHLDAAPNANRGGTANMLSARHLAVAAAQAAADEGPLGSAAINGAGLHGSGLGAGFRANGLPVGERQQPSLHEPMFVQTEMPGREMAPMQAVSRAGGNDQRLVHELMQEVQQLQQLQQQALLQQQLQKQWGAFTTALGSSEGAAGRPFSGTSTSQAMAAQMEYHQRQQVEHQHQQLAQFQRATAATLSAVGALSLGAMDGSGSALSKSRAECDLETLTQSVFALTMQLSRFEKHMGLSGAHGGNSGIAAGPYGGQPHSGYAPEHSAAAALRLSIEQQVNAAKAEVSGNGRGLPMPPWPSQAPLPDAALPKQFAYHENASLIYRSSGNGRHGGSGVAAYNYSDVASAMQMAGLLM